MKKIISCVLSLLLLSPYAFCAEVGRVTYVEGRVDAAKAGSDLAVPLREGDEISVGDAIRTKAASKAEVSFNDKSTIRLAQNSRVEIRDYQLDDNKRKTATIKLDRGKVRTIIAKTATSAPFNILTPNSEGQVKGSDIFTFYQAGSSGMLVAEGNLALKSAAHPETSISIPAGNSAFIDIAGSASVPRPYLDLEKKMHEQDTYIPPSVPKMTETAVIKGVLSKVSGVVKITPKGASAPRDASINDILGEGDQIETGDNGMVEIKFDNGCGLSLKPNTQIKITRLVIDPKTGEYQNLFESSKGKIKARIENLKGKSTFEIKTPTAICGARGTIMYVEITPGMAKAFFEGGNGYINNLISGAQTDIGMGSNGSADNQGNNSDPAPTSNEERDSWTQGWSTGDDTAGYSGGGGDTGADLGDLGGTSGGDTGGNTGGNTGGTNEDPNVYIPPTPNPTPPPAPILPLAFGYYSQDDGFVFDQGGMTAYFYSEGDIWSGPVPFSMLGNYTDPASNKLWDLGEIQGARADGASFFGWSIGTKQNDSLKSLLYAFYIRPDGSMGYLKSTDISGDFYPDVGIFAAEGTMTSNFITQTNLLPADLASSVESSGTYSGRVSGQDFYGTLRGESFQVGGQDSGDIFKETLGGSYTTLPSENWQAVTGGSIDDGEGYYIMHISGDGPWTDGTFQGTITGRDIGYSGNGQGWIGLGYNGAILGVYDEGASQWEAVALGYAPIADIAFGGDTTHESGVDYALFGGTEYLWEGSPGILFIGDYSAQQAPSRELWKFHTLGRTDDGGAIYGMAGGIKLDNVLKGLMYAIYVKLNPDYNPDDPNSHPYLTGYLESTDISGNVYPDIGAAGMFEADGSVTATEMGETSIRPDQLNEESGFLKREAITGKVGGDLVGNLLNAHDESESVTLEDNVIYQNWAVFRIEASGTYQNAPSGTGWTAVAGDYDNYDDGREGYWIAHLTGADWSDGQFSGTMAGRDLTYDSESFQHDSSTGTFSGKYKGTYSSEDNSWSMVGLGFSDAEIPLAFGGETTHESGVDYALFGGTQSLWAGSPDTSHDILFMGDYSAQGAPQRDLWRFHTLGATSDNAAIYGMVGGTKLNNVLKGLMYAIYIRPDPDPEGQYLTGYLRSTDISGNVYPDLGAAGMFEADGSVTATQMGQTAVSSSQLLSYMQNDTWNDRNAVIYRDEFSGKVGGDIAGDFSGESIGIDYSLTDQMWSIWRTEASGTYSPQPQGAWHAVIGGSDTESGDKGYFIGHINGPAWSGNEFSGDITGKDIWYSPSHFEVSSMGSMTGETVGTYANGTWSATNIGVTEEVSLTFGGEINITGDGFGYYDTVSKSIEMYHGSLSLLFGGTESLWTATPADPAQVTLIGEFANPDPDKYKLWGYNWVSGETADGAKYLGFLAGTNINNSLKGISAFLYVRPDGDGYRAGYLRSNDISGNFYTDISMLYATGHYSSDLDVSTDVLPSQVFKDSLFIKETDTHDDDGIIGGDISGNSSVGGIKLVEPDGTSKPWSIWGISCGGTFTNTPADPNDWHAVIGGKSTDETTGDLTGYWLGDINGDSWSANSLSGTVNVTGIDKFTEEDHGSLTSSQGNILGFYETNPNTWQALSMGVNIETPLTFGGIVEDNRQTTGNFSYYDESYRWVAWDSNSNITGLMGGTQDLWTSTPEVTIIGEFSNPENRKLWGVDINGRTIDGDAFSGVCGGIKLNNGSLKGISYAIYIRSEGDSYYTGYLRSTDLSGDFYPGIRTGALPYEGMFEATGTMSADMGINMSERETMFSPDELADRIIDSSNRSIGSINGGVFSGFLESSSMHLENEPWDLWTAGSGGIYTSLPTSSWHADMGGWSFNEPSGEIDSYWIGTISGDSAWQGNEFSGTIDTTILSERNISHSIGDALGVYDVAAKTWEALSAGIFIPGTELTSSGRFVAQGWNVGVGSSFDFAGLIGLTDLIWSSVINPKFISMGEFTPPDTAYPNKQFAWYVKKEWYSGETLKEDGFVSRYHDNPGDPYIYTTYDNGSFYGLSAGVGGDGKLKGKTYALYISPSGDAGVLYGDVNGDYYADIEMYRLDGELTRNFHRNIDMVPADLRSNISWDMLAGTDDHGGFGPESFSLSDVYVQNFNGTMLNISQENWGVWNFVTNGTYEGPTSDIWDVYDLTGTTTPGATSADTSFAGGSWLGGITGTKWNTTDGIEGNLDAIWIGLRRDGTLSGRKINGEVTGNYVEVNVNQGTWQAGAAGEWIEADALLDLTNDPITGLDDITRLASVNIPITEVFSSNLTGGGSFMIDGGGSISIYNFIMNFYTAGGDGIWAAKISQADYTTPTADKWAADVTGNLLNNEGTNIGTVNAHLDGDKWSNGNWQAGLTGSTSTGLDLNGVTAGAYTPTSTEGGTFTGGGTGTTEQQPL